MLMNAFLGRKFFEKSRNGEHRIQVCPWVLPLGEGRAGAGEAIGHDGGVGENPVASEALQLPSYSVSHLHGCDTDSYPCIGMIFVKGRRKRSVGYPSFWLANETFPSWGRGT